MDDDGLILDVRPAAEHGRTRFGPLSGVHHFCIGGFQRPDRIDWGSVRAVHEYRLAAGGERPPIHLSGFDILTFVHEGLARRTGSFEPKAPLEPGVVELVRAGSGARLGLRASNGQELAFTEVWLRSDNRAGAERCCARPAGGALAMIAEGPARKDGMLRLSAQAVVRQVMLGPGDPLALTLGPGDAGYAFVTHGALDAGPLRLEAGDGLALAGAGRLRLTTAAGAVFTFILSSR